MANTRLIDTKASDPEIQANTTKGSARRSGKTWAILSWLRVNISLVFELLTAGVGIVAFVMAFFVQIAQETLVEITVALLALLSITALLQRITKLENIERQISSVHKFISGGDLDGKIYAATLTANGSTQNLQGAGVAHVYDTLAGVQLTHVLSSATRTIRIMSNWVGCLTEIGEILARNAEVGCQIRVLILRHDSIFAKLRSNELGWSDGNAVPRQIGAELEAFDRLFREHPAVRANLQVKAFNARPPICMFAYDDVRFVGFFWPRLNAMNGPFLRLIDQREAGDKAPPLISIVDSQFENLWNDSDSKYIRLDGGEPNYIDELDGAWLQ